LRVWCHDVVDLFADAFKVGNAIENLVPRCSALWVGSYGDQVGCVAFASLLVGTATDSGVLFVCRSGRMQGAGMVVRVYRFAVLPLVSLC